MDVSYKKTKICLISINDIENSRFLLSFPSSTILHQCSSIAHQKVSAGKFSEKIVKTDLKNGWINWRRLRKVCESYFKWSCDRKVIKTQFFGVFFHCFYWPVLQQQTRRTARIFFVLQQLHQANSTKNLSVALD